ncbi:MAG: site-specific integrase [Peptococcaceae bacterium]|nr:MAG: site-specific integrase [Peptococcaceae bacterium]
MAKKQGKRANHEGTITKRSDGRWEVKITASRDAATGKPMRKCIYGKTQKEAKEKRDEYLVKVKTGTYVKPDTITLGSWVSRWLELFVQPKVKMSTYSKYTINLRAHVIPGLGSIELQKIATEQLQEFYNKKAKTLSSSALAILHQIINGSLKQAVKQKLIINNPAEFTSRPAVRYKEIAPLTANEVAKYLAAAKPGRLYPAFLLDITTGLRRGELLALHWKDVNLETGVLTVRESLSRVEDTATGKTSLVFSEPKTMAGKREVPILPDVVKELKTHRAKQAEERLKLGSAYEDNDLVFCTAEGKPLEPRGFLRKHKQLLEKAGLRGELRVHDLRHTFGTMLAQAGENPKNLQEIMGHADIRTTLGTYCHSSLEDKKRAIEKLASLIT